jgi:hypothetical protein
MIRERDGGRVADRAKFHEPERNGGPEAVISGPRHPQEVQALFRLCLRVVLSADGRLEFQASDWLMGG